MDTKNLLLGVGVTTALMKHSFWLSSVGCKECFSANMGKRESVDHGLPSWLHELGGYAACSGDVFLALSHMPRATSLVADSLAKGKFCFHYWSLTCNLHA